ncbi:MAG: class I SAM-dependent rRNA methyltransferase, partial [Phycisphaerae bacterium]
RLPCMTERDTDSFRLLTGRVEGIRGLAVEKYGEVVVLQVSHETPELRRALPGLAKWYLEALGVRAVYTKRFVRDRDASPTSSTDTHHSPKPFVGTPAAEQIVARERGLRFAVRPYDGLSVGLFLDHRDNRERIRAMSAGMQVLNLFAYTCGFSVAAAKGGADRTVSVDLSRKHLDWGRENFELNQVDPDEHEFFCSDAFSFLRGAARKSRAFDIIIIDPPSFAHGRKRKQDFSIARDLSDLIAASLTVLRRGGTMMVSTNYRQMSMRGLRDRVTTCAGRRKSRIIETPRLPADFACDPHHAKTVLVRFD